MSIQAVNKYLLVRVDKEDEISGSGILLPKNEVKRKQTAVIVSSPEGSDFKEGEHIYFALYSPIEIESSLGEPGSLPEGQTLCFIEESDVLGIIKEQQQETQE